MTSDSSIGALRVLAHPLRLRILSLLTGSAMSAAEAARELGDSQANVSYHLRRLQEAGLLEVAEEVRIRGGVAKRYRHDPDSGSSVHSRSTDDDLVLAHALATELQRRTEYRIRGLPGSMTDAELWVDESAWDEALGLAYQLSRVLHDAARPPRTHGTKRVSTTVSMFEMDPDR